MQALCLWDPDKPDQGSSYVCVEPTARHLWTVYRLNLPAGDTAAPGRVAQAGMTSREAAQSVANIIGNRSRLISRNANWRRQPASQRQRHAWQKINDAIPPATLTRGDASDAIAKARFLETVRPSLF